MQGMVGGESEVKGNAWLHGKLKSPPGLPVP